MQCEYSQNSCRLSDSVSVCATHLIVGDRIIVCTKRICKRFLTYSSGLCVDRPIGREIGLCKSRITQSYERTKKQISSNMHKLTQCIFLFNSKSMCSTIQLKREQNPILGNHITLYPIGFFLLKCHINKINTQINIPKQRIAQNHIKHHKCHYLLQRIAVIKYRRHWLYVYSRLMIPEFKRIYIPNSRKKQLYKHETGLN